MTKTDTRAMGGRRWPWAVNSWQDRCLDLVCVAKDEDLGLSFKFAIDVRKSGYDGGQDEITVSYWRH